MDYVNIAVVVIGIALIVFAAGGLVYAEETEARNPLVTIDFGELGVMESIQGEFEQNGFANALKHHRGVISMARTNMPDSAGSQFFIMVADAPHLDGAYAALGKVVKGMEVADQIVSVRRDRMDKPLTEQRMQKVTVETFGIDYSKPDTI